MKSSFAVLVLNTLCVLTARFRPLKYSITVKPNAKKEGVEAVADGFVVRVNAPPIEGRANERVIELMAKHLGVPKSRLEIVSGLRGKRKVLSVKE